MHQRMTTTTTGSSSGRSHAATPKCNNDCLIAKRNARLADALGISQEGRDSNKSVTYSDELVGFAKGNLKFLGLVEKTFSEWVIFDVWFLLCDVKNTWYFFLGLFRLRSEQIFYLICLQIGESSFMMYAPKFFFLSDYLTFSFVARKCV